AVDRPLVPPGRMAAGPRRGGNRARGRGASPLPLPPVRRAAALIVGGGPAGAAAATPRPPDGAAALPVRRHRRAHAVVCGGFLGGDAIRMLARIGLDPAALGAPPIRRARLIAGRRVAETDLPFAAAGLSRRALDAALLDRAAAEGAAIERGLAVRRIDP